MGVMSHGKYSNNCLAYWLVATANSQCFMK